MNIEDKSVSDFEFRRGDIVVVSLVDDAGADPLVYYIVEKSNENGGDNELLFVELNTDFVSDEEDFVSFVTDNSLVINVAKANAKLVIE